MLQVTQNFGSFSVLPQIPSKESMLVTYNRLIDSQINVRYCMAPGTVIATGNQPIYRKEKALSHLHKARAPSTRICGSPLKNLSRGVLLRRLPARGLRRFGTLALLICAWCPPVAASRVDGEVTCKKRALDPHLFLLVSHITLELSPKTISKPVESGANSLAIEYGFPGLD